MNYIVLLYCIVSIVCLYYTLLYCIVFIVCLYYTIHSAVIIGFLGVLDNKEYPDSVKHYLYEKFSVVITMSTFLMAYCIYIFIRKPQITVKEVPVLIFFLLVLIVFISVMNTFYPAIEISIQNTPV